MKIVFIGLLLSLTTMLSSQNNSDSDSWKFDSLAYSQRVKINVDDEVKGMQINARFMYPVEVPDNIDLKRVQSMFAKFFLRESGFKGTPKDAFEKFVGNYSENKGHEGNYQNEKTLEASTAFEEYRDCKIVFQNKFVMTVSSSFSSYTGGAHGDYGGQSYNIDKRDGTMITEDVLYRPGFQANLASLIQNVIAQRNLSEDRNEFIALSIDIHQVKPNGNFGFSEYGITYYYDLYEIAPYAQGAVEVIIPYDQILPLVNEKYLPVIQEISK